MINGLDSASGKKWDLKIKHAANIEGCVDSLRSIHNYENNYNKVYF